MLPRDEKPFHPHRHDPHLKGCTLDFRGKCKFLRPGDNYTDMSGRKYRVAEDGSLRRVKNREVGR
jgi:hypothetical protein